jgi:hypothetical protein
MCQGSLVSFLRLAACALLWKAYFEETRVKISQETAKLAYQDSKSTIGKSDRLDIGRQRCEVPMAISWA